MRLLLLCALLLPALASAQIYRWTDAQGRVHFGEQPGGSNAQPVEVKPQVVERDAATREREERAQAQAQAAEAQAKRASECRELRNNLAQIQRGGRYFVGDEQGNRTYISDEELDSARSRLSTRIAERCS
jgi:hypothetical protein